jgi:hypothetical protein
MEDIQAKYESERSQICHGIAKENANLSESFQKSSNLFQSFNQKKEKYCFWH